MVLMQSYIFYCSVRLGVLFISGLSSVGSVLTIYVSIAYGSDVVLQIIAHHERAAHSTSTSDWLRYGLDLIETYPNAMLVFVIIFKLMHIIACGVAAHGALKLKWQPVIPLAFFELNYFAQMIIIFMTLLNILKHSIGLGFLTLISLGACFYTMWIGYNCFALVAFMQIVMLVKSENYVKYYGPDPFNPQPKLQLNGKLMANSKLEKDKWDFSKTNFMTTTNYFQKIKSIS